MPYRILAVPKGGMSGRTRKRYAVPQTLPVLEEYCWLRRDLIFSLCSAAADLGTLHLLLVRWSAKVSTLVAAHKKIRKSIFNGTASHLKSIKEDLLMWIFVRSEQALSMTVQQVVLKASALLKNCFTGKALKA
jgi:hypothetical protein